MIEKILKQYLESDEEYIENCKRCFLKESKQTQEEIENASTDELIMELKRNNFMTFEDYRNAIKYELMLRTDFEIII